MKSWRFESFLHYLTEDKEINPYTMSSEYVCLWLPRKVTANSFSRTYSGNNSPNQMEIMANLQAAYREKAHLP